MATVIPYYHRFLKRFPTLEALADAPEQDVLRFWQGLGYCSRARNLQAAARAIVTDLQGQMPSTLEGLLKLPGVGRYTAGAIASIAFNRGSLRSWTATCKAVLCRLDALKRDPREREMNQHLWKRAEEILPAKRIGDFNSALMELGAMICTPRNPQCLLCPVREHCDGLAAGIQEKIPVAKKSAPTPLLLRRTCCIHHKNHWLMEQRPGKGRWAGMWQFVTFAVEPATSRNGLALPIKTSSPRPLMSISHALTHRRYRFEVFVCDAADADISANAQLRRWITLGRSARISASEAACEDRGDASASKDRPCHFPSFKIQIFDHARTIRPRFLIRRFQRRGYIQTRIQEDRR